MRLPFHRLIRHKSPPAEGRRWVYVPYDQLTDRIGPLAEHPPEELGIVLVESAWKAGRRPVHKQKLALILANMRHFALEQAERGVAVDYRFSRRPYDQVLADVIAERGPLVCMRPAERELRAVLEPLTVDGRLTFVPHAGWLTTEEDFRLGAGDAPPWRMDAFYRHVRKKTGILMDRDKPVGGRYSFDGDNRESWAGDPAAPSPPSFYVDPITVEVADLIDEHYAHHPGTLSLRHLPVTRKHAEGLWGWAVAHCLPRFGPYEDAMSRESRGLFHTRISPLLHLHRLLPEDVVHSALRADIPLNSKEGFVRQVLGWREFVRHVHEATDGFRDLPGLDVPIAENPGDGGFSAWSGATFTPTRGPDGGAAPSVLNAQMDVPAAFWGTESGLSCLDTVVTELWEEGWTHHIPRLMVLSNLATLLGVSPRALTDWFWVAYIDAFDWVVEPNVLGMGTFGAGEVMTTKPYVSGSAYIHKMSDYCSACRFHPKKTCPITPMYWNFLDENEAALAENQRMKLPLASLARRGSDRRAEDAAIAAHVRQTLSRGEALTVESVQDAAADVHAQASK
mgnify:CR=1 FL=1